MTKPWPSPPASVPGTRAYAHWLLRTCPRGHALADPRPDPGCPWWQARGQHLGALQEGEHARHARLLRPHDALLGAEYRAWGLTLALLAVFAGALPGEAVTACRAGLMALPAPCAGLAAVTLPPLLALAVARLTHAGLQRFRAGLL